MFALWLLSRAGEGEEQHRLWAALGRAVGAGSTGDARDEGMGLLWESFGNLS